jgi:predicted RNase H-like nuclease (RuvC/YqgF family)
VLLDIEPTNDRTDELIEELKDRVHRLEYQLDQERETRTEERRRQDTVIAQLSRANEEQARTIRQLEAPSEARESPQTVEEEPERAEPRPATVETQEPVRRPWWRRMFGG